MERLRYARKWRWAIEAITDVPFNQAKQEIVGHDMFVIQFYEKGPFLVLTSWLQRTRKLSANVLPMTDSAFTTPTQKKESATNSAWMTSVVLQQPSILLEMTLYVLLYSVDLAA